MFKKWTILIMAAMLILLVGCNNDTPSSSTPGDPQNSQESAGEPEVSDADIEITLPANMVEGQQLDEELSEEDIAQGFKSVRINEDGSVTYTIGKSDHEKLMAEFRETVDEALDTFLNQFTSLVSIDLNDAMTECTVVVNREDYESGFDSMVALGVYMQASLYQIMDGAAEADISLTVHVQDEATGETFDTLSYPEALA